MSKRSLHETDSSDCVTVSDDSSEVESQRIKSKRKKTSTNIGRATSSDYVINQLEKQAPGIFSKVRSQSSKAENKVKCRQYFKF